MPERIQRRRVKGWTMPAGAIYVGRPTRWGNPFAGNPARAVASFERWLTSRGTSEFYLDRGLRLVRAVAWHDAYDLRNQLHALAGKDLACWCPTSAPCHADVLLRLANTPEGPTA